MAKHDPAERLAAAAESIAESLAALVELQRGATTMTAVAAMPDAPLAGLAVPVARLAQAVTDIAATNARLAAERQQMRRVKEREAAALVEDARRVGAMGTP